MNISVVIPTLNNRVDYLSQAVNSVINQTFKPVEIIIVNNGRGSVETSIFEQNTDIRISSFDTVYRAGSSQARNFGGSLAIGDYVSFLDDDDFWEENYLEHISHVIKKCSPDCLVGKLNRFENGIIKKFKSPEGQLNINTLLIKNPSCTGSTVTFKKKSFIENSGYNTNLKTGQDKSIIIDFLLSEYRIEPVPQSVAVIRIHDGERNTDYKNYKIGLKQFIEEYKHLMDSRQLIVNYSRLLMYHLLSSDNSIIKKTSFIPSKIHQYFKSKVIRKIDG